MNQARLRVVIALLFVPASLFLVECTHPQSPSDAESTAVRQVVANFIDGFNNHDAHAWALPFTEDGDFTNVTGLTRHGRKEVEERFKGLFAVPLKDAHRTAMVKHIRFVKPDVAAVDAEWELVGSKTADGSGESCPQGDLYLGHGEAGRPLDVCRFSRIGIRNFEIMESD